MQHPCTHAIYFDNAATTRPIPQAVAAAEDALTVHWGNPSSIHGVGNEAHVLLEDCRRTLKRALGVKRGEGEVFFVGSGTEADATAILGAVYAKNRPEKGGSRGKILLSDGEHAAVDNAAALLEADGFTVLRVPTRRGALDIDFIKENAEGVVLSSFMLVNNETGARYDVAAAIAAVKEGSPSAVCHVDAVQAFMKFPVHPALLGADLLSVSAHKIGGLKGTGALYVSEAILKAKKIRPLIPGGGQEFGMRSGTENLPGITAFAAACEVGLAEMDARGAVVSELRRYLLAGIEAIPGVRVNVPETPTTEILSLTLPDIRSQTLVTFLAQKGICISAGSACDANSCKIGNRVLSAFGLTLKEAVCTVRVSLSHENTKEDADALLSALAEGVSTLQRI